MAEHDPDTERYAYSRKALARLVLSDELANLAGNAEAGVATTHDEYSRPGEKVAYAAGLVNLAKDVLARAVIYERQRGTSWDVIGESLNIKRQSAHARFADDIEEWETGLVEPYEPVQAGARTIYSPRLPDAAQSPNRAGRYLDNWLTERGYDDNAVTSGLPTLSTVDEMNEVLAGLQHLYRAGSAADPGARARLLERKAALLERIAAEDGRPEAAAQADEARAAAIQLRTEVSNNPTND